VSSSCIGFPPLRLLRPELLPSAALGEHVWTVALATTGVVCIVNALRCGRVHCYLTGPFFILIALVALSYGLDILRLGGNGWNLLGLIALIGAIALWCLLEMFLGKYRKGRAGDGNHR